MFGEREWVVGLEVFRGALQPQTLHYFKFQLGNTRVFLLLQDLCKLAYIIPSFSFQIPIFPTQEKNKPFEQPQEINTENHTGHSPLLLEKVIIFKSNHINM